MSTDPLDREAIWRRIERDDRLGRWLGGAVALLVIVLIGVAIGSFVIIGRQSGQIRRLAVATDCRSAAWADLTAAIGDALLTDHGSPERFEAAERIRALEARFEECHQGL